MPKVEVEEVQRVYTGETLLFGHSCSARDDMIIEVVSMREFRDG